MSPQTLLFVVGARPNYMKVAPVLRAMDPMSELTNVLVHTGQHYDPELNDVFFRDLELRSPDVFLAVGSGTHGQQTARLISAFEPVLDELKPAGVVVVGDVNSTLACSIVAAKAVVPVIHIEAGLRSFDMSMPEEVNRVVTDRLSTLLLTPSADADANLAAEGVPAARVARVGNVMIDSLLSLLPKARARDPLTKYSVEPKGFVLLTLHRPTNVDHDDTLAGIFEAVERIQDDVPVLFPVHPRTRAALSRSGLLERVRRLPQLQLLPPLGYLDFIGLEEQAAAVFTDSGGVQEETTALGVPCFTVRENTERPVTVSEGTNTVVGCSSARIVEAWERGRVKDNTSAVPFGWDGHAASRVAEVVQGFLWKDSSSARRTT